MKLHHPDIFSTIGHSPEDYEYLPWAIFPLLLGASTGNLSQSSLRQSLQVHELHHTHLLAGFQRSGLSEWWALLLTKNCLRYHKGRGVVSTAICANKVRSGSASANQKLFYSQPRQPPCAWHVLNMATHLPPIPPFLLVQNLSSKRITPTDNVRPNLHDEYTRSSSAVKGLTLKGKFCSLWGMLAGDKFWGMLANDKFWGMFAGLFLSTPLPHHTF